MCWRGGRSVGQGRSNVLVVLGRRPVEAHTTALLVCDIYATVRQSRPVAACLPDPTAQQRPIAATAGQPPKPKANTTHAAGCGLHQPLTGSMWEICGLGPVASGQRCSERISAVMRRAPDSRFQAASPPPPPGPPTAAPPASAAPAPSSPPAATARPRAPRMVVLARRNDGKSNDGKRPFKVVRNGGKNGVKSRAV